MCSSDLLVSSFTFFPELTYWYESSLFYNLHQYVYPKKKGHIFIPFLMCHMCKFSSQIKMIKFIKKFKMIKY